MTVFYNDNEKFVAQWLINLIGAGHLPDGVVDDRSIQEIQAKEVQEFGQAHFFAGIGGWPLALKLAGWPEDRPVWTGSCPCQPFSVAGRRGGTTDERHLWPEWFRLIKECLPPIIFGEQVASKDGYAWFDIVQADLESVGYACGMVVSPAAGYGAPHIRHRIYFVADSRRQSERRRLQRPVQGATENRGGAPSQSERPGGYGIVADTQGEQARLARQSRTLGNSDESNKHQWSSGREQSVHNLGYTNSFWANAEWLPCTDGKARPTQPGLFPLAHGVPARMGRLRAYGNAIVVPQAVEFILAVAQQEEREA